MPFDKRNNLTERKNFYEKGFKCFTLSVHAAFHGHDVHFVWRADRRAQGQQEDR
jgi:hypothetical protein